VKCCASARRRTTTSCWITPPSAATTWWCAGRELATRLLSRTQGNIARAAREAELDRKHLYSLLHKYGLVQTEEG